MRVLQRLPVDTNSDGRGEEKYGDGFNNELIDTSGCSVMGHGCEPSAKL